VPAILSILDVFVLPSLWEGFGLVLLEAMAAGRPIIASNVSAIPEVLKQGHAGILVPSGQPQELANAIIRLLEDEKLRGDLGKRGRELVESEFLASTMIDATIEIYNELLARQAGGASNGGS
jgi:glycosyltransferase involved in cell wall biosynthesis